MFLINYSVRECEYGYGIFAEEFIPKGMTVWKMTPYSVYKIPSRDWPHEVPELLRDYYIKFAYESGGIIYMPILDDRYMNHSFDPNVIQVGDDDVAARDIQVGEQIFANYTDIDENGRFASKFLYNQVVCQ